MKTFSARRINCKQPKRNNKKIRVGNLKLAGTVGNRKHAFFYVWPEKVGPNVIEIGLLISAIRNSNNSENTNNINNDIMYFQF